MCASASTPCPRCSIDALAEKWAQLSRERDQAAARQIRETMVRAAGKEDADPSAVSGDPDDPEVASERTERELRLRCAQLEHAYQESLQQIAKLTALVFAAHRETNR